MLLFFSLAIVFRMSFGRWKVEWWGTKCVDFDDIWDRISAFFGREKTMPTHIGYDCLLWRWCQAGGLKPFMLDTCCPRVAGAGCWSWAVTTTKSKALPDHYIWWIFDKCKSMCTWTLWTWQSVCFQVRWRRGSNMSWFNSLTHVLLKCLHRNEAIPVASQIGRVFQQGSGIFLRDWYCPILRQTDLFPGENQLNGWSWILPWYPWGFGKFCWTCVSRLWSPKEILVKLWQPPTTSLEALVCHWGILLNRLRLWLYAPYYVCRIMYIDDYHICDSVCRDLL